MEYTIDFDHYKQTLLKHCQNTIEEFAKKPENQNVYSFVLDAEATYGGIYVRWNSLDGLAHTLTFDCYKNYSDERVYGFRGLKHSVGDFRFEDAKNEELWDINNQYGAVLDQLWDKDDEGEEGNRYIKKFMNMLIEVVGELSSSFDLFNKTEDFIAYVVEHDEEWDAFIHKTVSKEQFYKAFPEIKAYEEFKADISRRPIQEQVDFWCQTYIDFKIENPTEHVMALKKLFRYDFDIKDQLVSIGKSAVPTVVTLLEKIVNDHSTSTDEKVNLAPWICQSILIDIGTADENDIQRLITILANQRESNDSNASNTERILTAIDPVRFPNG
ncbi:DUF4303 domain-containing protein [Paenibacillus glycanilyticus]|uniref:DUF4303 domain-containing protein n=1 Tax=Paenibacillus glycanilyticus TaxID=126569 RepID=UPI00203D4C65|nr:DUF4303 domain-containing protein [Paenibacillus glycanilyticus]MCM3631655.1 DUF4303 domain-containing protein [Paenibacillus glycanilyticus]